MPSPLRRLYPLFRELWVAFVLIAFFVVRVLGSHLGQRLLTLVTHRPAQ